MKAYLLDPQQDFDFAGDLPPNHEDLVQDLELNTLLGAMALGDKFLFDVARKVLLRSLSDPEAILYRQRVLADCIAEPDIIREMYAIAVGALQDKRGLWGYSSPYPASILSGAVRQLEVFVVRLRELRQVADSHSGRFRSAGPHDPVPCTAARAGRRLFRDARPPPQAAALPQRRADERAARPGQQRNRLRPALWRCPPELERARRDRAPHLLLLHDPAPR